MYLGQKSFIGISFAGELTLSYVENPERLVVLKKTNQLDQIKEFVSTGDENTLFNIKSKTNSRRSKVFFDKQLRVLVLGIEGTGYEYFISPQVKETLAKDQTGNLDYGKLNSFLMRHYGIWEHVKKIEIDYLPLLTDIVKFSTL
jgi:hypothetical protein